MFIKFCSKPTNRDAIENSSYYAYPSPLKGVLSFFDTEDPLWSPDPVLLYPTTTAPMLLKRIKSPIA